MLAIMTAACWEYGGTINCYVVQPDEVMSVWMMVWRKLQC